MSDPFGRRDEGLGGPKPPAPFEMPGAVEKPRERGVLSVAVTIPIGAAIVGALFYILAAQDPNRRREATAVIPAAASTTGAVAPRRGAIARSAAKKKLVVVNDFATDIEAEAAARETCGQPDCVLIETFAASCVAKAAGKGDRQEIAYGHATREDAEKAALAKCGKACSIQTSSCPEAR